MRLSVSFCAAALLAGCSFFAGGGGEQGLYVVFEDLGEADAGRYAFLPDGTPYYAQGFGLFRLVDGERESVDPGVESLLVVTAPDGGVLVAHADGFVWSSDGSTWEARADAPEGLRLRDMLDDREGAIYATYTDASGAGLHLYESRDSGVSFEAIYQVTAGSGNPSSNFRLARANALFLDVVFSSPGPTGVSTFTERSRDGGRSFVRLEPGTGVDPGAASMITSGGVLLARQTLRHTFLTGLGWHTDQAEARDTGWRPVRYIGIPGYTGPPSDRFTLDPEDRLALPFGGRLYRTVHPISTADPGADIALAGPGCRGAFDIRYDANINFEPAVSFTVRNTNSSRIDVWEVDHAIGFQHRFPLEPGESVSEMINTGKYIYVRDTDHICLGVEQVTNEGDSFVF